MDERHEVVALGTNQTAADMMVKAGARHVVLENGRFFAPLLINRRHPWFAQRRVGGIFFGEVTQGMVAAILETPARKLLLPLNRRGMEVIGTESPTLDPLIDQTIQRVQTLLMSGLPA